jgi:hypothetical protein
MPSLFGAWYVADAAPVATGAVRVLSLGVAYRRPGSQTEIVNIVTSARVMSEAYEAYSLDVQVVLAACASR